MTVQIIRTGRRGAPGEPGMSTRALRTNPLRGDIARRVYIRS